MVEVTLGAKEAVKVIFNKDDGGTEGYTLTREWLAQLAVISANTKYPRICDQCQGSFEDFRKFVQHTNDYDAWWTQSGRGKLARPEWRPIETAPKDGTPVLVFHINSGKSVGMYRHDAKEWAIVGGGRNPTHWMPLPKSPL